MNKVNNKNKSFLIIIIIVILFSLFLISLPSIFNTKEIISQKENIKSFSESSRFLEENKLNYIAKTITDNLKQIKITNENNKYIMDLISNNEINNRDNSIGQEILHYYLNENPKKAKLLSLNFIETRLNLFDSKKDRKWRNEILYLIDGENTIELYQHTPLLTTPYNAKIVGVSTIKISPYEYQIYNITLNNNTKDIIKININSNKTNEKLNKYLGIENEHNYKNIKSTFIESEKKYEFKFIIWK